MGLVKATFYLPLADNNGRDLSSLIAGVEDDCFREFGAWTLTGYFKGSWRMRSGERKLDTSAVYSVVVPKPRIADLEAILRRFKAAARQETVYLEIEHQVELRLI